MRRGLKRILTLVWLIAVLVTTLADTRTLETRFALSADPASEFKTQFSVLSPGRIVVEGIWSPVPVSLRMILYRPDGSEATQAAGASPLIVKYKVAEREIDGFISSGRTKWAVRVINNADPHRRETAGRLRTTVPASSRLLQDTQFTLAGSGNAQEIPFVVPAPGRIVVEADWMADQLSGEGGPHAALALSLIHPGQSRTYARRHGSSPLRIEHQVTEQELERGARWIVRAESQDQRKIKGRARVTYTPGL